jgi:hypothetical protein
MSTELQDEPEIIRATKTVHGYLASPLSEHISEMPDGSLLIVGCPIARTGWQEYAIRDLPQERAKQLGIDISNPSAMIDLYRPASEVFKPEFLASLNGRPVTDNHPPGFVDPTNFNQYSKGHIQNPRKGPHPLEDGEWPVIADIVISGEPLVGKVRTKQAREISLGYDFTIDRDGDRIIQCDYVANHTAVVPKGRAGDLIAIGDAAPDLTVQRVTPPEPAASPPEPSAGHVALTTHASTTKKEKPKVKNNLLHLLGLGLRAKAADAETDPEDLAQAAVDVGKFADDKRKAGDEDFEIEETGQVKDRKRKAKDLDPEIEETHTNDRRSKMHDALDKMLDAKGKDEDLNELGDMLKEFFGQEAKEPEHQATDVEELPEEEEEVEDADPAELEELLGEGEEPDEEEADDAEEEVGPGGEENLEEEEEADDRKKRAKDRATAHDGAVATLKMLRPVVARCKDAAMKNAFNTALASVSRASRARTGDSGYSRFAAGSRARSGNLPHNTARAADAAADANAKLQKYYDERRKGGK